MSKKHPIIPEQASLSDLQKYEKVTFAYRGFDADVKDEFLMLVEEAGELAKALRKHNGVKMASDAPDQNVAHEVADVLWALMTICNLVGIDLEQAFRDKEEKNKQRVWK
jgi:NTP pyrophosphatase (non-canonical NTP hydrolase)